MTISKYLTFDVCVAVVGGKKNRMSLIVKVGMPFLATQVLSMPRGVNWQNTPLAVHINPTVPLRSALCLVF